jgi:hypothetical protein
MSAIHATAMKPLTQLLDSNLNFHKLELMMQQKIDVDEFRYNALESEFCKFFTGICEIFKEFGDLKNHFNIPQMLKTMKIPQWKTIRPFEFYLTPLEQAIKKTRTNMLNMHKLGPLRMAYIIEKNTELAADIDVMVKKDNIAQLLMGDELKQDQFEFFYKTAKIIYDSALCGEFINMKSNKSPQGKIIEETVIPELIAFHSVLNIRNIQLAKAAKAKKDKEKAEFMGESGAPEEVVDPNNMTEEQVLAQRMENEKTGGIALSYDEMEKAEEKADRKQWGRTWIWEGYFNPKI